MKRWMVPIALVTVIGLGSYALFAQQDDQPQDQPQQGMMGGGVGGGMSQGGGYGGGYGGGMMGRGMMQGRGGMMGRGMMGGGMMGGMHCPACMAMGASIMQETVTPTNDGGVVVSVTGELIKYDANLNRVKEVNLNIDWGRVHQMAQQIMQNCPMHRRMMQMMQQSQEPSQWQGQPPQ